MISRITTVFYFGALILISTLAGCSSSKSRVGGALSLNTDLTINFDVGENINPDASQRPSPVFLRLYELADPTAFEKADFIDIYERDAAVLGDSLVARQQLKRFAPDEKRTESIVLKPETRYVGLYAEFLQYQDAQYKVVFQVTQNNILRNVATIKISENRVSSVK